MTQDQLFKQMTPELQGYYELFYKAMYEAGLPFELNEVLRTKATQEAYYAQGRLVITEVNRLRKVAGLSPLPTSSFRGCHENHCRHKTRQRQYDH